MRSIVPAVAGRRRYSSGMSRYRAAQPRSSPYITRKGFARLNAEVAALWLRRRDVVTALSAAAAEGDRSENAEYHYRKKELGGIDRRIRYLQKRIPDLEVIDALARGDRVFFGAFVDLELHADGKTTLKRVRIVGADEIDPATGGISIDSPLARALLGKGVDDEVEILVEERVLSYAVLGVDWPAAPDSSIELT